MPADLGEGCEEGTRRSCVVAMSSSRSPFVLGVATLGHTLPLTRCTRLRWNRVNGEPTLKLCVDGDEFRRLDLLFGATIFAARFCTGGMGGVWLAPIPAIAKRDDSDSPCFFCNPDLPEEVAAPVLEDNNIATMAEAGLDSRTSAS